ncbi:MAG: hypothetical protein AB2L11_05230 [Syntrophobacteraceae bacterium]
MTRKRRERAAYHEAGHAVIGYRFGHRIGKVSIKSDEKRDGYCEFNNRLDDPEHQILMLLAGHAAQKARNPDHKSDLSLPDFIQAWRVLNGNPSMDFLGLVSKAERLVSENIRQIQAVAQALLECETLVDRGWTCIIDDVDKGNDWKQGIDWISSTNYEKAIRTEAEEPEEGQPDKEAD